MGILLEVLQQPDVLDTAVALSPKPPAESTTSVATNVPLEQICRGKPRQPCILGRHPHEKPAA